MKKLMGNMVFDERKSGEVSFDPSKANLDPTLFEQFSKVMEQKSKDPEVVHLMQEFAKNTAKELKQDGVEFDESEIEFLKKK